ncbi:MAG: right-handed parallel beta-helix repeat-containing protein [Actinomycetota bacterium]|nr:right-handed parallel beta-helix repeat-containing protein [Actinomycetota bacterium]
MSSSRTGLSVGALLLLVSVLGVAAPAQAKQVQQVSCGQVITSNTTLGNDVGPCPGNGIIVGADNVKLDLNGHRVFGTPQPGEGAGILVSQRRGVQVRNGTVSDFDGGVVIEGGTENKVFRVTARDNIGRAATRTTPATQYGDGIAILSSTNNLVLQNMVVHNGPYSGIGLYELVDSDHPRLVTGPTFGNIVNKNTVLDNNICRAPTGPCDDDGIRLEPGVEHNTVTNNVVMRSALDGIGVFRTANENVVRHNTVEGNGFHTVTHRKGDGIRIFSHRNVVEANQSFDNAGDGIAVGFVNPRGTVFPAVENRIIANRTGGNLLFDLHDYNPNCDANLWQANTYQTATPPCTTAP